jgi:hypothetical protein
MSYQEKYLKYKAKYIALKSKQSQSTSVKINNSNIQSGGKSNNMLNIDNLTDTPLLSNILDGISQGKTQSGGNLSGALKDTKSVINLTETPRLIDIWGGHYANKDANKLIKLLSESENNNTEDKHFKINGGAITDCKASELKKHVDCQFDNKLSNNLNNEINYLCDIKKSNNEKNINEALKKLIDSTIDILTVSDVNDTETVSAKSTGSTIDSAKVAIGSSSAVFKQLNNNNPEGNVVAKPEGIKQFNNNLFFGGSKKKIKTNKKNFFEESDLFSSSIMSDSDLSTFDTTINSSDADL